MLPSKNPPRIAIVTFTYEQDRHITFELLESLFLSFRTASFDIFLTDDASSSHVGDEVIAWARERGMNAYCLRDNERQGFRGAIDRTIRVLKLLAAHPVEYDVILRIDTDAWVIKSGLDEALLHACNDPGALYGVMSYMRPKDRVGLLLDLLPGGLKRKSKGAMILHDFAATRRHRVWWSSAGMKAFGKGFRFGYVQGSCYALGGRVPRMLEESGYLGTYDRNAHGLLTSEEDIMVTMLCHAAGIPIRELDRVDPSWKHINTIGERVLDCNERDTPYVIHALKADAYGTSLRKKIREKMSMFGSTSPS